MSYEDTPARQEVRAQIRGALEDSVVPKELRARALELVRTISDSERRTHAWKFVTFRGRNRSQLEAFIKRMEEVQ